MKKKALFFGLTTIIAGLLAFNVVVGKVERPAEQQLRQAIKFVNGIGECKEHKFHKGCFSYSIQVPGPWVPQGWGLVMWCEKCGYIRLQSGEEASE